MRKLSLKRIYNMNLNKRFISDVLYTVLGSLIIAIGFNMFMMPLNIAPGGVSGFSTVIYELFGINPALTQWAIGIPILILGAIILGKNFAVKTVTGTICVPLFILLTGGIEPPTSDPLLGAIFGGVLLGCGLALAFKGNSSTGGTDTMAQILNKVTGLPVGFVLILLDGSIILLEVTVFGLEQGLYMLICLYVYSKTISFIQVGFSSSKSVMIVSDHEKEITQAILEKMKRGVTKIDARGGYTDSQKSILLVVVSQKQYPLLSQIVKETDPSAFLIVTEAAEVRGNGFRTI